MMNYDEVAGLYDNYVNTDYDFTFFLDEAKGLDKVLEITSGTGRLSLPLIKSGVNLTCIDFSKGMLDILKQKLEKDKLKANLIKSDMSEFNLNELFDLVVIPFQSFSELVTYEKQIKTLKQINKHLNRTGHFICTLHNPEVRKNLINGKKNFRGEFNLKNGNTLKLYTEEKYDPETNIVSGLQYYEIYDSNKKLLSSKIENMQFCLHSKENFKKLLDEAGFNVAALYGSYDKSKFEPLKSPCMIWKLRKNKES